MNNIPTFQIVKSAALALMLAGGTTALGAVVVENSDQFYQGTASTENTISSFTVTEGNKLVVVGGWENASVNISGITYGGQSLTEAVASSSGRRAEIWYLDSPAATTADVVVSFTGGTVRSRFGVMSLTGTHPGGPIAVDSNINLASIDFTTPADKAFVVGVLTTNNQGLPTTGPFGDILYSGDSGSSYSNAGSEFVATAGLNTYTWTGGGGSGAIAIAAFAAAVPEPSTLGLLAVGTIGLCMARRRRNR